MNLWSDFLTNDGRVIHKWKHYFPIYERHFRDYVDKPVTFIEIGCGEGGSLQMWKRYFGPHARIIGLDIDPAARSSRRTRSRSASATSGTPYFWAAWSTSSAPPTSCSTTAAM